MKAGLRCRSRRLASHSMEFRAEKAIQYFTSPLPRNAAEPGTLFLCQAGFVWRHRIERRVRPADWLRHGAFDGSDQDPRAVYSCQPSASIGSNPVSRLARVLDVVDGYERGLRTRHHPLLGAGSCTPTMVRAGVQQNAVADFCDLNLDRRLIPAESVDGELAAIGAALDTLKADDPDLAYELTVAPYPLEPAPDPARQRAGSSAAASRRRRARG